MRDGQGTPAWQRYLAGAPLVKPIPTDRLPQAPRAVEPLVYRDLCARCEIAAATPEGAVVAALYDQLTEVDLEWLTGSHRLPPLAYRTVRRAATHPQVELLVGCFTASHLVGLGEGHPTFAGRARAVPELAEEREPARCAVQVSVAVAAPAPGRVAADPVTTIVSTGPHSAADVRVVLDDDALRIHWTVPDTGDHERAVSLGSERDGPGTVRAPGRQRRRATRCRASACVRIAGPATPRRP